jgi:hypothetical protein
VALDQGKRIKIADQIAQGVHWTPSALWLPPALQFRYILSAYEVLRYYVALSSTRGHGGQLHFRFVGSTCQMKSYGL